MSKTQVITGVERRRRFSDEEKARFVAEIAESSLNAVARKYGISCSVLYVWKKKFPPKSFALIELSDEKKAAVKAPAKVLMSPLPPAVIRVIILERIVVEFPGSIDPDNFASFIRALEG